MFITSKNIKIFPGTREPQYDLNASKLTEQNINSIVNRFTNKSSWIINGLNISYDNLDLSITKGDFCIQGYYFQLLSDITIKPLAADRYLYLCMNITNDVKDSVDISRLKGIDDIRYDYSTNPISVLHSEYTGIYFLTSNREYSSNLTTIYFKIGQKINNQWLEIDNIRDVKNNRFAVDDLSISPNIEIKLNLSIQSVNSALSKTISLNLPNVYYIDWGDGYYSRNNLTHTYDMSILNPIIKIFLSDKIVLNNLLDEDNRYIKKLSIDNYITSIGKGILKYSSNLQKLTLPFIGNSATAISASPSTLFGYIFGEDSYEGGVPTEQNHWFNVSTTYYIPSTLEEVIITGGNILYGAFSNCSNIQKITLSDTITSISTRAFYYCSGLTNVYYDGTLSDWCKITFSNEYSNPMYYAQHFYIKNNNGEYEELTEIEIPSDITEIKDYTFCGFNNVTSITIPESVKSIGEHAFRKCSSLTNIEIPSNVITIGYMAFIGCTSLTSIIFENNSKLTSIGNVAFSQCTNLTNVSFGENSQLKSIGYNAFLDCSNLTSIAIPNSVTSIGKEAFRGCSSLISITLPNSVTSIGEGLFSGCLSLEKITLPFVGDSIKTSSDTYQYPFGYIFGTRSYTGGVLTTQNYYGSSTSSTTSADYYIPITLEEVTILRGNLLRGAFENCSNIEKITLGDNVTSIGSNAFYNCSSLTSIVIPAGISIINASVFSLCKKLQNVSLPNTLTTIGDSAFYYCDKLTNITLPNNLISIGNSTFYYCTSLTNIEIPSSVTSIGNYAFIGCFDTLTGVTFQNPNNWKVSTSSTMSNPISLSSSDLSNTTTAANYLTSLGYYCNYFWKRY